MKLSIHQIIKGKPTKKVDTDGRDYYENQGRRVSLGYGWINIELDWPDVFELITVDGCASSAELNSDNRRDEHFVSRELFMVDIDAGMTINDLRQHGFYQNFGAGFYTTPSHTPQLPRFRILFRTQTPVKNSERARLLIIGLMRLFDHADPACKDSTRLFYGTVNAVEKEITDRTLPDDLVDQIIEMELEFRNARFQDAEQREYAPISDAKKRKIIELLKRTFVGEYNTWRNVGWGLKNAGFSLADFQYVTAGMMNQKTAEAARVVWNDGKNVAGGCTIGTVIHLLKERHGEDCLALSEEEELTQLETNIENGIHELKRKLEKWQQKISKH